MVRGMVTHNDYLWSGSGMVLPMSDSGSFSCNSVLRLLDMAEFAVL